MRERDIERKERGREEREDREKVDVILIEAPFLRLFSCHSDGWTEFPLDFSIVLLSYITPKTHTHIHRHTHTHTQTDHTLNLQFVWRGEH